MHTRWRSILILGAPGSGKGTQSKLLCKAGHLLHISSGYIFRTLPSSSSLGQMYHKYASQGELAPDDITITIWHQHIMERIATRQYDPQSQLLLLDGIPRTIQQAKMLEQYIEIKKIIVLQINDQHSLIQRLEKRATIEKRKDDMDNTILYKRMQIYQEETFPLMQFYPEALITSFNGDQHPSALFKEISNALFNLLDSS